jgi:hypothetical protein
MVDKVWKTRDLCWLAINHLSSFTRTLEKFSNFMQRDTQQKLQASIYPFFSNFQCCKDSLEKIRWKMHGQQYGIYMSFCAICNVLFPIWTPGSWNSTNHQLYKRNIRQFKILDTSRPASLLTWKIHFAVLSWQLLSYAFQILHSSRTMSMFISYNKTLE